MKKLILSAFIISAPVAAIAAGGHGPAGCGLGTKVIFQNADEWHEHVLAATTNLSSGNQTFGMTSGTLDCEDANGPLKNGIGLFFDHNLEQLATEAATGSGETLSALSELIGIHPTDDLAFKTVIKTNFDKIFASVNTTSDEAFDALVDVMRQDTTLAKYLV